MNPPTLFRRLQRQALPRTARTGDLAVVNSVEAFVLETGHRLRAAPCLLCRQLIGGRRVAVVGLAALAGDACHCGAIGSDVFLIHASHFPVDSQHLSMALHRGMDCGLRHPAHC